MTASSDQSRRFVLADRAPLLINLAALWATQPHLARALDELEADAAYALLPTRSGAATVMVNNRHLHSRYDPVNEAAQLIDSAGVADAAVVVIHGCALAYHAEAALQRIGPDSILCIVEPDLRMIRTALVARDLGALIRDRRVMWFWQDDKSDVSAQLAPHQPLVAAGVRHVDHPASTQLHAEFHARLRGWFDEFAAYARTTVATLVLNGKRTAENVTANLPWYVASPSLARLENRYAGKPAIIVSAGPSLRKNGHLLKGAQGKAAIIAVQTTLKPLLEIGVEPHFVTSLDYHDICTRFFEKLSPTLRTELVAEPKATSAIFDMHPGCVSLLGNEFAESLLAEMKLNKTRLRSGATVAHLAFYLAEHLGCDPIIFVGQDLGFSDGLCYAPGTSYDDVWRPELGRFCTVEMKQWEQIVRDRNILRRIPDQSGAGMYTEERLFTYLQHFERDFAASRATLIDATEGGALKRGTRIMPLRAAIEQYCTHPVPAAPAHPGPRWDLVADCAESLRRRLEESRRIEGISRETLPLLQEIRDNLTDQPRVNMAIARIDALRAQLDEIGNCYALITQLTQQSELTRFHADRKISAAKVDGVELQRRQVTRDIDNVQAVLNASIEFQRLMQQAISNVDSFKRRHARAA